LRVETALAHVVKQYKLHVGRFLPLSFAGAAPQILLVGGTAAVTKALVDEKKNREYIEELEKYNLVMERRMDKRPLTHYNIQD
jgi:hypothetical protein